MGWKASADAIRQRWNTNWTTPTHYDNAPTFEPPQTEPWVRLTVQPADVTQRSLGGVGGRCERVTGFIGIQIFTPLESGDADAWTLADSARALLEGQSFDPVTCRTATAGQAVRDPEGGPWWMLTLSIPFYTDETF